MTTYLPQYVRGDVGEGDRVVRLSNIYRQSTTRRQLPARLHSREQKGPRTLNHVLDEDGADGDFVLDGELLIVGAVSGGRAARAGERGREARGEVAVDEEVMGGGQDVERGQLRWNTVQQARESPGVVRTW